MAVRIRCKRVGRRNRPCYHVDAFDSRTRRDGRCLEHLGIYDPLEKNEDKQVTLKADRIRHWLSKGAKPTDTVRQLLLRAGVIEKPASQQPAQPRTAEQKAQREAKKLEMAAKAAAKDAPQPQKLTKAEKRDAKKAR